MENLAARRDRVAGVSKVHRMLSLPGCVHVLANTTRRSSSPARAFFVRIAGLEMHPLDALNRAGLLKDQLGPRSLQHHQMLHGGLSEEIRITTTHHPLKERVVDEFYDPLTNALPQGPRPVAQPFGCAAQAR